MLSSVTADYLYSNFSREREGFLTKSRSNPVCRERLNELAIQIGLDKYVHACGVANQHNNYIYGNVLEALVGAIYIDKGYKQCRRFLLDRVFACITDIESVVKADKNYKSRLIEWGQKQHIDVEFCIRELSGRCFISLKKVLFLIKVIPNFAYVKIVLKGGVFYCIIVFYLDFPDGV